MKKTLLTLVAAAVSVLGAAQNIDQVYTSNGSVYEGYISEQVPGESISVYAEKATIVIPSEDVVSVDDCYRKFSSLSRSAQDWFRQMCDTSYVRLATVRCKNCLYDDVIVQSRNSNDLRIVAYTPRTYNLDWKNVIKTTKTSLSDGKYGLKDIVTLKSGERLVGTIVEQIVGESLSLKDEFGEIHHCSVSDILSTRSEMISDDYAIWNQTPLLDRIEVDGKKTVEGFVVSRIMGKKLNILLKSEGYEEAYDLNEITKYQKYLNPDYIDYEEPVVDTVSYVKVNRAEQSLLAPVKASGYNYVSDSSLVEVKAGGRIRVELKNIDCAEYFSLYRLKITKYKAKDSSAYVGKAFYAFKDEDEPIYECSPVLNNNGVYNAGPVIRGRGTYFLVIDKSGKGLIIEAI